MTAARQRLPTLEIFLAFLRLGLTSFGGLIAQNTRTRRKRAEELKIMDQKLHWENAYQTKMPSEVSWYRPHLEVSLQMIADRASNHDATNMDVGGGESTLVDDLTACGYRNVCVIVKPGGHVIVATFGPEGPTNVLGWM